MRHILQSPKRNDALAFLTKEGTEIANLAVLPIDTLDQVMTSVLYKISTPSARKTPHC